MNVFDEEAKLQFFWVIVSENCYQMLFVCIIYELEQELKS